MMSRPPLPFFVASFGNLRRRVLPSTWTISSSPSRSLHGIRSASDAGRICWKRSSGSRKCESPEWAQIFAIARSWFAAALQGTDADRRR
jgi:hypothetical protein